MKIIGIILIVVGIKSLSKKLSLWIKIEFLKNVEPFPTKISLNIKPEKIVNIDKTIIGVNIIKLDSLVLTMTDLYPLYFDKNTHHNNLIL